MTKTPDESPGSSSESVRAGAPVGASAGAPALAFARPWLALTVAAVAVVATALLLVGYPSLHLAWMRAPGWAQALIDLVVLSLPFAVAAWTAVALASTRGAAVALGIRSWRWTDAALGVAVALVVRAVVEVLAPTTGSLTGGLGTDAAAQTATTVVTVVGIVVVTPLIEEAFFRGVVVRALRDATRPLGPIVSRMIAVVVSAALFAGLHVVSWDGSPPFALLAGTIGVGLGTGILVVVTGRLGGAIIAHVVFNALGVILLLL